MAYKRISPIPISEGGTNATTMATTDGTVYYDGTRLVTTATGTSGQVLTSAGPGVAPSYASISGGTLTGFTNHAVPVGTSAGGLTSLAVGATGEGLMGNSGADPSWTGSPSFSGLVTAGTGFTATTGNVTVTAGNVLLPTTSSTAGQIQINSSRFMHAYGTTNTFLGSGAGNFTLTGSATGNVIIGQGAGPALTDGSNNASLGRISLKSLTTGTQNVAIGNQALETLTTSGFNTALGSQALQALGSGARNISIGYLSGTSYTGSESHNIVLSNTGTLGDSNTIRIGTTGSSGGQQNKCFIAGINGSSITPAGYLTISSADQVSTASTTNHAVQVGNSTGTLTSLTVGTNGQVLVGSTGADPAFATLTSSNSSITFTTGAASLGLTVTQATTTQLGGSTIATNAEAIAGTDTSKIITADDLKAKLGTQTNHGVLVGAGTSAAVTALAVGSTGQLLVGASSADPAFASSATGDFTFTSSTAGATRTFTTSNTDNTNSASTAAIVASVGGSSAGDAVHQSIVTGATTWTWGVDNSASDAFVIAQGTALGTNNIMSVATTGEINYPLQSSFLAIVGTTVTNVTGDGTLYTVIFGTEIYDQNSDYNNSTGVFTAPVTGRYNFTCALYMQDLTSSHTRGQLAAIGSNRFMILADLNVWAIASSNAESIEGAFYLDMDAADTVSMRFAVFNGTKVVDLFADGTNGYCFFGGQLLA